MNTPTLFDKLGIDAERLFREAFQRKFYGVYLFDQLEQDYYQFTRGEAGDSVWIVPEVSEEPSYSVKLFKVGEKFPDGPVTPRCQLISHCQPLNYDWFEDKKGKNVERALRQGGISFAQKANEAFPKVLLACDTYETGETDTLDLILADVFSQWLRRGHRLDKFLFPAHLEAKFVQQGLITRDDRINNDHYIGQTLSGQEAFSFEGLSEDTAIVFASETGILLFEEARFSFEKLGAFRPGMCGYLRMNPVIKDVQGVVVINGVDSMLRGSTSTVDLTTRRELGEMFVDSERKKELQAISATDFDLTK